MKNTFRILRFLAVLAILGTSFHNVSAQKWYAGKMEKNTKK